MITPTCALQVPCNVTVKGSNSSSRLCYLLTRVIYTSGEVCLYLFFIDIDKSFLVNKLFSPVKCVNYMVCMNLEDTFTFYFSIIHLLTYAKHMFRRAASQSLFWERGAIQAAGLPRFYALTDRDCPPDLRQEQLLCTIRTRELVPLCFLFYF